MVISKAFTRALALWLASLALACGAAGCTAVMLSEDPTRCGDGIDNDVDGLPDTMDPDCTGGGENTLATCRNGGDDDGDGRFDCEDTECVAAGHCNAFDMNCNVLLDPGDSNNCPRGMFCYPGGTEGECRLPGTREERQTCRRVGYAPGDAHDCAPDYYCVSYDTSAGDGGICAHWCNTDPMVCEVSSFCPTHDPPTDLATCWLACDPRTGIASGCPPTGWRCLSFHELGPLALSYAMGGAHFQCANDSYGVRGTAELGMPCADPPNAGTALTSVCRSGLMCMPDGLGTGMGVCRLICNATAGTGCAAGETCTEFYDGVAYHAAAYMGTELGYCHL